MTTVINYAAQRGIVARYDAGTPLVAFSPAERATLRAALVASPAYQNANHSDHAMLAQDARALYAMDFVDEPELAPGWQLQANLRAQREKGA